MHSHCAWICVDELRVQLHDRFRRNPVRKFREHTRFDDPCGTRIQGAQLLERLVEREDVERRGRAMTCLVVERHPMFQSGTFLGAMTPRVIDEDLAHGAGGDVQKVHPVGPGDPGLVNQLEPGFVYELGGLERVTGAFVPHQGARDAASVFQLSYLLYLRRDYRLD